jgi:hypothetical protein
MRRTRTSTTHHDVMAGLVPAIHVFALVFERGCPASQASLRSLRKLGCVPAMTDAKIAAHARITR